ncbi:F-box/LRR-repeat protein [Camellia lanceoleosa]|uniref:F-box/LRR-repeat protein n=1 Tax=Camellia lanceoleosa TaxID=1840588 RepID=A0ACC0GU99_9ERIC|nr:F-box/LRR-repeat protein [Camellia lanceoleosa]
MSKWKALEILVLGSNLEIEEILSETVIHCKNLVAFAVISGHIEERHASAIVNLLPNIKYLSLRHAHMARENLVMILKGCKELEYLDVSFCGGFDEGDGEILKLASHISTIRIRVPLRMIITVKMVVVHFIMTVSLMGEVYAAHLLECSGQRLECGFVVEQATIMFASLEKTAAQAPKYAVFWLLD